jgi:uncharacterized protein
MSFRSPLRSFQSAAAVLTLALASLPALAQDPVVYHIDDTAQQALGGLRNIRNHLDVDPKAKITSSRMPSAWTS